MTVDDLRRIEDEMVSDGPAYSAQFEILVSDYSVDEIEHKKEAELGRGTLALIAKHGARERDGSVRGEVIVKELTTFGVPEEKAFSLLSRAGE